VIENGLFYRGDTVNGLTSPSIEGGTPRIVAPYMYFLSLEAGVESLRMNIDSGELWGESGTVAESGVERLAC
jgi:hypothetical protein